MNSHTGYLIRDHHDQYKMSFCWDLKSIPKEESNKIIKLKRSQIYVKYTSRKEDFFVLLKQNDVVGIFMTQTDIQAYIFPEKLGEESGYSRTYCSNPNATVKKRKTSEETLLQWYDEEEGQLVCIEPDGRCTGNQQVTRIDIEGTLLDPDWRRKWEEESRKVRQYRKLINRRIKENKKKIKKQE